MYIDGRWPLRSDVNFYDNVIELCGGGFVPQCEGDALIICVHRGNARVEEQVAITGKKFMKSRRGTVLMLLLPNGQMGWIVSDGSYPKVTAE